MFIRITHLVKDLDFTSQVAAINVGRKEETEEKPTLQAKPRSFG